MKTTYISVLILFLSLYLNATDHILTDNLIRLSPYENPITKELGTWVDISSEDFYDFEKNTSRSSTLSTLYTGKTNEIDKMYFTISLKQPKDPEFYSLRINFTNDNNFKTFDNVLKTNYNFNWVSTLKDPEQYQKIHFWYIHVDRKEEFVSKILESDNFTIRFISEDGSYFDFFFDLYHSDHRNYFNQ